MSFVVTTGCPNSGWEMVIPLLEQGGFAPGGEEFTHWLEAACQVGDESAPLLARQPLQPSRTVIEGVGELLTQTPSSTRLLADSRNLWLIDFWAEQLPEAKFLLFYVHPETAVASALAQGLDPFEFLDGWQAANQQLLRFQRHHRTRALLLDAEAASRSPEALVEVCGRIGLSLDVPRVDGDPASDPRILERLLASRLLTEFPAVQMLQMELEASAQPLGSPGRAQPQVKEWVADYLEREAFKHKLQGDLEAVVVEKRRLETAASEQREQLQEQKRALEAAIGNNTELTAERERIQEQLAQARESCDSLETARKGATEENELLLLQLHQVQEELEKVFSEKQQLEKLAKGQDDQILELKQQVEKAAGEKSDLASEHKRLEAELEESRNARDVLDAAHKDIAEENELLLLQLHQVQEELEHYFLKYQELEMCTGRTDTALQDRHPEFCTAEKLILLGGNQEPPFRNLNCLIEGLTHGERKWGKVNVKLLDTRGEPGVEFRKGSAGVELPVEFWQETGKDDSGAFMALRPGETASQALLAEMPAQDWLLLNGLPGLMIQQLRTGCFDRQPKAADIATGSWSATARRLRQQLSALKPVFRFDAITLREAHVAPGYEHLWLEFTNAHFADRLHPQLSFKLGAKAIKAERFTNHAVLAFREQESGYGPFDAWPPLRSDDFGPVLSLDFGVELNETQRADWDSLTADDRAFLDALIDRLPAVLEHLKRAGHALDRPWEEWQQLVAGLSSATGTVPPADAAPGEAPAPAQDGIAEGDTGTVTFKEVKLGEVNRRPDYEHLRLDFEELRTGRKAFPEFSVKLGATDVRDGKFTGRMVLAFRALPEGRAPLECWDKAARDEHGPVVRLAFGGLLSEEEQSDWARLTGADRKFIDGLLAVLPDALDRLKGGKSTKPIQRDWADWLHLVRQQIEDAAAA